MGWRVTSLWPWWYGWAIAISYGIKKGHGAITHMSFGSHNKPRKTLKVSSHLDSLRTTWTRCPEAINKMLLPTVFFGLSKPEGRHVYKPYSQAPF